MKRCKLFLFVFLLLIIFTFSSNVSAAVVGKKCIYNNSTHKNTVKIELSFYDNGNYEAKRTSTADWSYDLETVSDIAIEDFATVSSKFKENQACPAYIMIVDNWFSSKWHYYAAYTNGDHAVYSNKANFYTNVYTNYFDTKEDIDDGTNPNGNPSKEFNKTFYPSGFTSGEYGDLNMTIIYDEVNGNFTRQLLKFTKYEASVAWVHTSIDEFKKNVLNPIVQSENYPTDFYCGVLSAYLSLKSSAQIMVGQASNGNMVCSTDKNLFNDGTNKLYHYTTKKEKPVDPEPSKPDNDKTNNDDKKDNVEISDITTGQICKSNNLKTPLKYVGWILSMLRILVPIIIIVLGVIDFFKALTNPMNVELTKSIKAITMRVIAGIVIFLVPAIINFLFVLIDEWNDYSSAYSECTTCLFDPKNC